MNPSEIIEALGGRKAVCGITGATLGAVKQWDRIGVPAKYWPDLVQHAARSAIPGITFDALRAARPPAPPSRGQRAP